MDRPESFCQGCGSLDVVLMTKGNRRHFCASCYSILRDEVDKRSKAIERGGRYDPENTGPNFLTISVRSDGIIGDGLFISTTPAEAMAESMRLCLLLGSKFLKLDVQGGARIAGMTTCDIIYRTADYWKFFPGVGQRGALPFDEGRWGVLPLLWEGQAVPTISLLPEMEQMKMVVKREYSASSVGVTPENFWRRVWRRIGAR